MLPLSVAVQSLGSRQRARQRALGAGLADGRNHVRHQHGLVEGAVAASASRPAATRPMIAVEIVRMVRTPSLIR